MLGCLAEAEFHIFHHEIDRRPIVAVQRVMLVMHTEIFVIRTMGGHAVVDGKNCVFPAAPIVEVAHEDATSAPLVKLFKAWEGILDEIPAFYAVPQPHIDGAARERIAEPYAAGIPARIFRVHITGFQSRVLAEQNEGDIIFDGGSEGGRKQCQFGKFRNIAMFEKGFPGQLPGNFGIGFNAEHGEAALDHVFRVLAAEIRNIGGNIHHQQWIKPKFIPQLVGLPQTVLTAAHA